MSTISPLATFENGTFRTQRVLPHLPEAIFAAFAQPNLLAQWWGPNGFTNTFETFEFKPGGHWKFVMHGPDGANYPNENIFRELHAATQLVIQHVTPPHFTLTVTLKSHGTSTEMIWTQAFDDANLAKNIRHIIEPANEQNLDRLTEVLSREKK